MGIEVLTSYLYYGQLPTEDDDANVTTTQRYDRRGEVSKRAAAERLYVPEVGVSTPGCCFIGTGPYTYALAP